MGRVLNVFAFLNIRGNAKFVMTFSTNFGLPHVSNIFTFERIRSPCVLLFCQRQCKFISLTLLFIQL